MRILTVLPWQQPPGDKYFRVCRNWNFQIPDVLWLRSDDWQTLKSSRICVFNSQWTGRLGWNLVLYWPSFSNLSDRMQLSSRSFWFLNESVLFPAPVFKGSDRLIFLFSDRSWCQQDKNRFSAGSWSSDTQLSSDEFIIKPKLYHVVLSKLSYTLYFYLEVKCGEVHVQFSGLMNNVREWYTSLSPIQPL